MKIYIDEEWDSGGCEFVFSEDISKHESDDPYIFDIDDKEVTRWKKIAAEKERIDREYYDTVQKRLYQLKRAKDKELVEIICPGCGKPLVFCRDDLPSVCSYNKCPNCHCFISRNTKDTEYVVKSGDGIASIDTGYRPTDKEKVERTIRTFKQIEKQGGLKKK